MGLGHGASSLGGAELDGDKLDSTWNVPHPLL